MSVQSVFPLSLPLFHHHTAAGFHHQVYLNIALSHIQPPRCYLNDCRIVLSALYEPQLISLNPRDRNLGLNPTKLAS